MDRDGLKDQPIAAFQIWNEPSNFDFRSYYGAAWNAVDDAPLLTNFVEVTGKAARAIKRINPRATVLVKLEGSRWSSRYAPILRHLPTSTWSRSIFIRRNYRPNTYPTVARRVFSTATHLQMTPPAQAIR
jgi:hypothetical protein